MRPRPFLLLAGLALALMAAGETDAAKEPLWSYTLGESTNVHTLAISADGEYIVVGTDPSEEQSESLYLFDKEGNLLWSYETGDGLSGSDGDVRAVAISADGEYVVAGSMDGKVYLFDKDSGTPLWDYDTGYWVASVAISADGEYLSAVSASNHRVYLFDKDSSTPLWSYESEFGSSNDVIDVVSISEDGEYIVAGFWDQTGDPRSSIVFLFDKDSGSPLWNYTWESDGGPVEVDISADGEYIAASIGSDNKVYLFDKDSSTPLWSYATGSYVHSVAISADGEYITAGSGGNTTFRDNSVYLFEKGSSTPLWNYRTGNDSAHKVYSVAISADGEYIAAVLQEKNTFLFGKDSSTPLWNYKPGTRTTGTSVAISADGENVVSAERSSGNIWKVSLLDRRMPPVAALDSISPSPARFDAEVAFSGTGSDGDGTVVAYEWNSDIDGFLSDEEDFSIAGLSIGNHSISFRVQDNDGNWSYWSTAELYVYPNAPPVGTIDSIEPSPAEKGMTVFFNGTGSDENGTIVVYLWGSSIDGELSTDEDFSSSNLSLGHHTIAFQVQDNDGNWSDTDSETLWIYTIPVAIAGGDITVEPGGTVQFSGAATDEDGSITKYEWDFDGDGVFEWSSAESGLTTFIYNDEGLYYAVLRVTDNDDFTSTNTRIIAVGRDLPAAEGESGDVLGIDPLYIAGAVAAVIVVGGAVFYMQRDTTDYSVTAGQSQVRKSTPTRSAPMFSTSPSMTAIECPGCNAQMKVPKLGKMQTVTCDSCGLSGEIEV